MIAFRFHQNLIAFTVSKRSMKSAMNEDADPGPQVPQSPPEQNQGWCSLICTTKGHRSLLVASACVYWFRDMFPPVLL